MIDVILLSEHILWICAGEEEPISHYALQKILYYIQGAYLVIYDRPLFFEPFRAWAYGPILKDVYSKYVFYGAVPIAYPDEPIKDLDPAIKDFILPIVRKLRKFNVWNLKKETHFCGEAWQQTYQDGIGRNRIIPKADIKKEFSVYIKKS